MISRLKDLLRALFFRRRFEADMAEEFRFHIEQVTEALVRRGVPRAEAMRQARAGFGAVDGAKEEAREARGIRWFDEFRGDLRSGFRTLRRAPGFALVSVLTLALGIGANTTIFSVINGVLLKPLPFPESHRLVHISREYPLGALWTYRSATSSYAGVAAYEYGSELNLYAEGTPERIQGRNVSAEFFSVLGATPRLGRTFRGGEDAPGAAPVAVIGEGLWRRRFGADSAILGRNIQIDGAPREVIGVVPRSFEFPSVGTDVWVPIKLDPKLVATVWGQNGNTFIGRLKAGVTVAKADAEHRSLITRVRDAYPFRMPDNFGQVSSNHVRPLGRVIGQTVQGRLGLLFAAVGVLLLIACVNVANLNLTRLATREREVAVRQALGGSRFRIARQLIVEQLVVATAGGVFGVALALAGTPLLLRSLPPDTPRLDQVTLDLRVLAFTGLVILFAGLLTSLGSIVRLPETGKAGILSTTGRGASAGPHRARLSRMLIGTEVALSVVLCIGAVILLRSLSALLSVDPGVSTERLTTARVTPNPVWCKDEAGPCTCNPANGRCLAFFPALEGHLAALAGVRGVALATTVPLDGGYFSFPMDIEDHPVPQGQPAHLVGTHTVSPGYFSVLGIPLQEGRGFIAEDRGADNPVVIINRTMAERRWPGRSALGKQIKPVWIPKWATIVGVVADVRYEGLSEPPVEEFYMSIQQWGVGSIVAVVKSDLTPTVLEPVLRKEVSLVDPTATVSQVRSMDAVLLASAASPRTTTTLISLFAGLALLLGAIGVYGVLSYEVSQRRREIGIRMAIGAEPAQVRTMVIREGALLLVGGVVAGLGIAFLGARVLKGFTYGVSVHDPVSYAAVPLLFAIVGLAASYLPARRATLVPPREVLQGD